MPYPMTSRVLIVVTDAGSRALGEQLHQEYGWLVVLPERPLELLRQVMLHDAGLVVLTLGRDVTRAVCLIERLRSHWRRVRVVAIAARWDAQAEAAVRQAGAAMCLQLEELEDAATTLLARIHPERYAPSGSRVTRTNHPHDTMSLTPP